MDKKRIIKYGKNIFLVLILLLSIIGLNIAVQKNTSISNQEKQTTEQNVKLNVALVNEDNTVSVNGSDYNLGSSYVKTIERNSDHNWSTVSRGTADKGLQEGTYHLVLTIPSDFSTKILDINNINVDKAIIAYKINANGNLQVENEANKLAKDIVADLQSQLIDMYMASILGNLYQAQRNVQTLSDTKVTNISTFRNNLYQVAVDFRTLFPNLVSTADSTLAANGGLREALAGNVTAYEGLNTAQTDLKGNLSSLIEQRAQGKISQEEFTASLLAMNSSMLNTETAALFTAVKERQEELTALLGSNGENGLSIGYIKLVQDLEQNIAELRQAIEDERAKLAEQEAAIAAFAEAHLAKYYGSTLDTIDIATVLSKSTSLSASLSTYQANLDRLIQEQLATLPSLNPAELETYLNKLDPSAAAAIQFDTAFATEVFGANFTPSNDLETLKALGESLDSHIQAESNFQAPTATTKATISLVIPDGFTLVSWEFNGVTYTSSAAEVTLKEQNNLLVTLSYEKSQTTVTSVVGTTGDQVPDKVTTTTENVAVGVAINDVVTTTANFDWDTYRKGQEDYRKAQAAYAAKVQEIITEYNQANLLINSYYPINSNTGKRESLTTTFFQQDAKSLLVSLLTDSITANLKSYGDLLAQEQTLNEKLQNLEGKKEELKEQLLKITTTNDDLAKQISSQLLYFEELKAKSQAIAEGQTQQVSLQGAHDTDLSSLATALESTLSITDNVKTLSMQNVEEATNVNTIFTNFNNDVQSAQVSGERLSSEATSLMDRFEEELSANEDFVETFTSVLSNTYSNGVPNEVLLSFLSDPLSESSSSVRATANTYRPFTWILLLEMVSLFTAYIFGSYRIIKAVKDKFKVNKLDDTDLTTVLVLSVLSLAVGALIGTVSSQQLSIESELIPTWVLMFILFSLLLVQGQYFLIKNAKGIGMGLSFFMVISFIYLSNAIGTTTSLTGLPSILKAINPLSVLESSLSGYFDGEAASVTVITTILVLGIGFALLNAFFDKDKLLFKKEV